MLKEIIIAGFLALKEYIAAHVLTCLVPAFLLAGAMVTFISREAIIRLLGEKAGRIKSFSLASVSSFFLAACSCTVIPVSSGLYFAGASIGVAFIILWVAPAANILSLIYTGSILGSKMVASRVAAALIMAFIVGGIMTFFFGKEERPAPSPSNVGDKSIIAKKHLTLIILIFLSLLLPNYLVRTGAYAYKVAIWAGLTVVMAAYASWTLTREEAGGWLRESWWFVRTIFPLLLAGVFAIGIIGAVLPRSWIQTWLGGNGLRACFLINVIGAIDYFATMTEAPFIATLMKLGMGKGPALVYLLTAPGVSLPSALAIGKIFGARKAFVYYVTVIIIGTVIGWFFGNFIL